MGNTSSTKVFHKATSTSTPVEDTAAVKVVGNEFELAIQALQAEAASFSVRFINDASVRGDYTKKTSAAVKELIDFVKTKKITPHEGAQTANSMRNQLMELARARTSDFGQALARDMKPNGLGLVPLEEKYAQQMFSRGFDKLTQAEKESVWTQIVHKAGQSNPKVSMRMRLFGNAGRVLLVISLAVAVYNIVEAEDKTRQTTKEGVTLGSGLAGGAAGAAAVAFIVSNPAGWLVGLGIVVGSAAAALGSSELFDYFWPER
jgi:ribosomal protein S7